MKTFSLKQFVRIKAVFTVPDEETEKQHIEPNAQPANTTNAQAGAEKLNVNKFQRKAHMGNFFAGPHCVFDPRLF